MSRKPFINRFRSVAAGDMQNLITSPVTTLNVLDNIGIQLSFTGTPAGAFAVQISADYQQDYLQNVIDPGNWVDLELSPAPVAAGEADSIYIDLNQLSAPNIRVVFTPDTIASGSITVVADTGVAQVYTLTFPAKASLDDGEYLVLEGAAGGPFAIAVDLTGTSPEPTGADWLAVPSNRRAQVDLSSGAISTAAEVAAAFKAAFLLFSDGLIAAYMTLNDTAADGTMTLTGVAYGEMEVPNSQQSDDSGVGNVTNTETTPFTASPLQSAYFTIQSPLSTGEQYTTAVWINVSGGGVQPEVEGADQYIDMPIAIGASDATVDSALAGVITQLILQDPAKLANLGGSSPEVTFDALTYGAMTLTDGVVPTGFTFAATNAGEGTLNVYLTAKGI